jgi:hypothetical protein
MESKMINFVEKIEWRDKYFKGSRNDTEQAAALGILKYF